MRRPASESDLAWVVKAKAHENARPQRAAYPSGQTYWCAYMAWWQERIALEQTAPLRRVTAAEVAAYEERR